MTGTIESTLGRFIFNEIIPQDLGFVDREVEGNEASSGSGFPRRQETVKADS